MLTHNISTNFTKKTKDSWNECTDIEEVNANEWAGRIEWKTSLLFQVKFGLILF